jgi:hypothetical protein
MHVRVARLVNVRLLGMTFDVDFPLYKWLGFG